MGPLWTSAEDATAEKENHGRETQRELRPLHFTFLDWIQLRIEIKHLPQDKGHLEWSQTNRLQDFVVKKVEEREGKGEFL